MHATITAATLTAVLLLGDSPTNRAQLANPETVIYDFAHERYLVSNMSSGDIVEIDHDGSYNVFNSDLSSVYGMTIVDNTLYVSSNDPSRDGIVGFDLTTTLQVVYWDVTTPQGATA